MELRTPLLLREPPRSRVLGLVVAIGSVALCTLSVYPLKTVAPAVSLGVVYLLAVIVVSTFWGFRLGLFTAFASAVAFNFFHIPPVGRFTIAEAQNWVALAVFFVAAAIASTLAELARSRTQEAEARRREADLMAELARTLLGGPSVDYGAARGRRADRAGRWSCPRQRCGSERRRLIRAGCRCHFPTTGSGWAPWSSRPGSTQSTSPACASDSCRGSRRCSPPRSIARH